MVGDAEVEGLAREFFTHALGARGVEGVHVASGVDHNGDPSFFVTVHLRPGVSPTDVEARSTAHVLLLRRLLDLGEDRFPYLRYRFAGDEELVDEDEVEGG